MTTQRRPDLGLLAEYAEGLLDGTPASADVADLLATDARWARAYTDLLAALPVVRDELAGLPDPGPLPADVAARLDATLAEAGAAVVPLRALRARRRRLAAAIGGLSAAAIAVTAGVPALTHLGSEDTFTSGAGAGTGAPALPDRLGATRITRSGTDYAPARVRALASRTPAPPEAAGPQVASVGGSLDRLTSPAALAACLETVRLLGGPAAPPPASADFGRYGSAPAIVVAPGGDGSASRVVVGPSCGLRGADVVTRLPPTR
jgi:hypothetical protein